MIANVRRLRPLYSAMLHETSSRSTWTWPVLHGIKREELPATHTFYTRKGRATPGNLRPQLLTAVTHCLHYLL